MELKEDLQTYLGRAKSGLRAKIEYSIELCRKASKIAPMYDDEGYLWLGFSGGKDSQALYHIAQLSGVKFKAYLPFGKRGDNGGHLKGICRFEILSRS